jgi:hypothetical protein
MDTQAERAEAWITPLSSGGRVVEMLELREHIVGNEYHLTAQSSTTGKVLIQSWFSFLGFL